MANLPNSILNAIIIILGFCILLLILIFIRYLLSARKTKMPSQKLAHQPLKLIEAKNGSLENFEEDLYKKDSCVGLILGARGSGKSALGMLIAQNFKIKSDKKIYAIGFDKKDVPSFISVIENPDEIKNNSFVLIDEGGVFFSSRDSQKEANKIVSKLILLARHKDLSILFITQNSANLEINTIRQADYLMLKPSSLLQLDFERKKIKDIYQEAQKDFEKYRQDRGLLYIYSDTFKGFVSNTLPSFWSKRISKTLENKKIEKSK